MSTRKKQAPKRRAKRGPPFKPIGAPELAKIEEFAGYGLSVKQIACIVDISAGTLRRRKISDKSIADALSRGKAIAEQKVGKSLYQRALLGDVAAIRWWEMTRANRTEASRHEVTGADGQPLQVEHAVRVYLPHNFRDDNAAPLALLPTGTEDG